MRKEFGPHLAPTQMGFLLSDHTADICKKSELVLSKHPTRYWGTGCCSSSAGEIATSVNRGGLGSNPLNPLMLLLFTSASAGIYNTASASNTLEKGG